MNVSKHGYFATRCILIGALACLLLSPTTIFAKVSNLTILHTNDQHGHFMKFSPFGNPDIGGMAAQSTLINMVRAEVAKAGGYVLLLSGGDVNTGVPESDLLNAEPDFNLMNTLKYDAMALGNHEFDKPQDVLMKQKGWAKFPFLSANTVKKGTSETLVDPSLIKEFDGLKVAIFGLTTEEVPLLVLPDNVKDLEFKSAVETAKALVPKLKEKADLVIALTHLGIEKGENEKFAGDVTVAKAVPGINVIVGGHTHDALKEPKIVGETLIVQAGDYSQYVGRLDLTYDSDAKKVTASTYQLLPVNFKKQVKYTEKDAYFMYADKAYPEDPAVTDAIRPYVETAGQLLTQPVGEALVKLDGDRKLVRAQETNLANLVTDAMRAKTGAEIAFITGGGIRADIAPGKITYRDILTVQPFGNTLVVMDLTGEQLMAVLNFAATLKAGSGGFLQVAGLKWTNNKGKAENVLVSEAPLDLKKTYKVVTNNFTAAGGDGYAMLKDLPKTDTNFVDADALREYIGKLGKVEPKVEGRLTIVP